MTAISGPHTHNFAPLDKNRRMLVRMKWLFFMIAIVVGILVWLNLMATLNRRNSAEFDRKARKARKFGTHLPHPTSKS